MVQALQDGACDGIGLARPLGAEPYLCKEILEEKITGAIEVSFKAHTALRILR